MPTRAPAAAPAGPLADPATRSVVLVRLRVGLGDLLCTVPALRALRRSRPDLHVALLTWRQMQPVVDRFAGYVDELVDFPGWPGIPDGPVRTADIPGFLDRIRRRHFDLAVQMYGFRAAANEVTAALGARRVAGFHDAATRPADPATHLPYPHHLHEVHRHLLLLGRLGVPSDGDHMEFPITAADRAEAARLLGRAGTRPGRYAVLHPGASSPSRRWPVGRWAAVGDALAGAGLQVLVSGVPGERAIAAAVVEAMREPATDLCGGSSLGGFAALLDSAAVVLGNDTGTAHLAVAVDTPSVTVFLAGDPRRWAGLRPDRHLIARAGVACSPCPHLECPIDFRCATGVGVDDVLDRLAALSRLPGPIRRVPDRSCVGPERTGSVRVNPRARRTTMASDDTADGHASAAARDADAVGAVQRNTKTQTTAASYTTTDHDVIRAWAEARGARPAAVDTTGDEPEHEPDAGLLRFEFRDNERLDEVDWEPFFRTFDGRKLAFVYQEKTSDGKVSRFNKFVSRDNLDT